VDSAKTLGPYSQNSLRDGVVVTPKIIERAQSELTITAVLDDILPPRTARCQRRPSDPWFDDECRHAKRRVRRFERAARTAAPADAAAAHAAWTAERRAYRDLRRQKRESFWTEKVRSEKSCPSQLWRSVNELMGRGSRRPVRPLLPLIFTGSWTTKLPVYARRRTGSTATVHTCTAGLLAAPVQSADHCRRCRCCPSAARQAVCDRPDADAPAEAARGRVHTVSDSAF